MKKLLLSAAATAILCSPAFAADTQSHSVAINGTSPSVCTLTAPTASAPVNVAYTAGTPGTLAITDLASTTDASLQAASVTLTYTGMCNYAHNIGLMSLNSGLQNATAANDPVVGSGSFIKKVGYTLGYTWAGHTAAGGEVLTFANTIGVGASPAAAVTKGANFAPGGANSGDLVLSFVVAANAAPVVAGNYSDTITVKIGAAL